jgi:nucleoside-diphosphate-sugar epimerase
MFHALYGAPVVMLRPFMAYGPGQTPSKLVPSVVNALIRGEAPKLSSGATRADWVFIDDVAGAYVAAATAAGVDGATIDLGSGALHSVRDVVERLVAITKPQVAPLFGALPDRPAELEVAADTALAASLLDWTARTSLDEGLRRTVEWRLTQLRGS